MSIVAIDDLTGVLSNPVTFYVTIRLKAVSISMISGTGIQNLTYTVGSAPLLLNVPQYTVSPPSANVNFSYSLDTSTPAFVNLISLTTGLP